MTMTTGSSQPLEVPRSRKISVVQWNFSSVTSTPPFWTPVRPSLGAPPGHLRV